MPWGSDHDALTRSVGAWRSSHNPYARREGDPGGLGDPPPAIFHRLMNAWKTGEAVSAIERDWRSQVESNRTFNAAMRAEALGGFVGDTEAVLDPERSGTGATRDQQTGEFVSVNEKFRDAQGTVVASGGMVPAERPSAPADPVREAYWRAVDARANHDRQGNDR